MGTKRKKVHAAGQQLLLSKTRLDELVEEALVDAYGESEHVTGFYTIMENDLRLPFETKILGMTVLVEGIDITEDDQLVAVCRKDKTKQSEFLFRSLAEGVGKGPPNGLLRPQMMQRGNRLWRSLNQRGVGVVAG
jgi:hypothetical protein